MLNLNALKIGQTTVIAYSNNSENKDFAVSVARAIKSELQAINFYLVGAGCFTGPDSDQLKEHFHEHLDKEKEHADRLLEYLLSMNSGKTGALLSQISPVDFPSLVLNNKALIQKAMMLEQSAIELYYNLINEIGDDSNPLSILIQEILQEEQEHANDWNKILLGME